MRLTITVNQNGSAAATTTEKLKEQTKGFIPGFETAALVAAIGLGALIAIAGKKRRQ